jgi:cytochrome P450
MSTTVAETPSERLPLAPTRALDHLPGEPGWPLVGHTLAFVRDAVGLVDRQRARYGPTFRIRLFGYPTVVVGDPDAVKTVFLDRNRVFSSRLGWAHAIGELFADGLMLRDFEEHRLHRRIMQTAFRAEALREYYPFGGGAHTCLGMHFAYLQVKAFLHRFLQRYRAELVPEHEVTMLPIPIPKPREGLALRLERIA